MDKNFFRKAEIGDLDVVWKIILEAKAQMQSLGSSQWDESYPLVSTITNDIRVGDAYVMLVDDEVAAYCVISFKRESAYNDICGSWISDVENYVVVHRLAVSDKYKQKGLASKFMRFAENIALKNGCMSFRVDTNFDNQYMLAILDKLEFIYCGKVFYPRGERLAYEKYIR